MSCPSWATGRCSGTGTGPWSETRALPGTFTRVCSPTSQLPTSRSLPASSGSSPPTARGSSPSASARPSWRFTCTRVRRPWATWWLSARGTTCYPPRTTPPTHTSPGPGSPVPRSTLSSPWSTACPWRPRAPSSSTGSAVCSPRTVTSWWWGRPRC